jgi:hypothetical protein
MTNRQQRYQIGYAAALNDILLIGACVAPRPPLR